MSEASSIIYKYLDIEGARKTISNCTLKFARPSEMNDPFDVYIDDLFNTMVKDISLLNPETQLKLLIKDPNEFAKKTGQNIEVVQHYYRQINELSEGSKAEYLNKVASVDIKMDYPEFAKSIEKLEEERLLEVAKFKNTGIFCATKNKSNLLMWAHYGEKHRGAVLGFLPDIQRDSFLRLLEPVAYSDRRPNYYEILTDWESEVDEVKQQKIGAKISRRMTHSKSSHWAYEEELRLAIPSEVSEGNSASFLKYYPNELVEIYLGCQMSDSTKNELAGKARNLNPFIKVFTVRLAKDLYDLEFEEMPFGMKT